MLAQVCIWLIILECESESLPQVRLWLWLPNRMQQQQNDESDECEYTNYGYGKECVLHFSFSRDICPLCVWMALWKVNVCYLSRTSYMLDRSLNARPPVSLAPAVRLSCCDGGAGAVIKPKEVTFGRRGVFFYCFPVLPTFASCCIAQVKSSACSDVRPSPSSGGWSSVQCVIFEW